MGKQQLQQKKRRLVLFPCPLQGHINPILQLATILYSQSQSQSQSQGGGDSLFSITIVHHHFNSPNPSNYPNFTFKPISADESDSPSLAIATDVILFLSHLNVNYVAPFKDCMLQILSEEEKEEVAAPNNNKKSNVIIISDAIMHFTKAVADQLGIPRLVLRTSSAICFEAFAAFPYLLQIGLLPIKESELESLVPELPPLKVKDLPVISTKNPEILYKLVADMINKTKHSQGLIWNSFESLEQSALDTIRKDFPVPVFSIGPFHRFITASSSSLLTQDHTCISWLNTQSPGTVLYISFGSLAAMDPNDFLEVAWGLANSHQPFLWVIRPGLVRVQGNLSSSSSAADEYNYIHDELLPQCLKQEISLGRGCIVKWAPQQEVLAHPAVGGFWTHSGWNSTLESICEGVPMICWPCFGDQMVNARYVDQVWRVGLQLEHGLIRQEIESAITRLMVEGTERDQIMASVREFKDKAELSLSKGGSSFNSLKNLVDLILSF